MTDLTRNWERRLEAYVEKRFDFITSTGPDPWERSYIVSDLITDSVSFSPYHGGNWKERIARHQQATTDLTGARHILHGRNGYATATLLRDASSGFPEQRTKAEIRGYLGAITAPGEGGIPAVLADADNQALMRFHSSLLSARNSIPGLVAAGEIGETLRMIRRPGKSLFSGLYRHIDSVKKRVSVRGISTKKKRQLIAESWLEQAFGWRPLISDVQDAARACARLAFGGTEVISVHGSGEAHNTTFYGNYGPIDMGHLHLRRDKIINVAKANVRYSGVVGNNPDDWNRPLDVFGVNWRDVLPAAWELIPYSFLADYFSNIGSIIQAFSNDVSGIKWCEKHVRTSSFNFCDGVSLTLSAINDKEHYYDTYSSGLGQKWGYEIVRVTRRAGAPGIPSLEFKIPGLGLKWLNIAALGITHSDASRRVFR